MSSRHVVAPHVPPRKMSRCRNWSSVMRTLDWPRIHSEEENTLSLLREKSGQVRKLVKGEYGAKEQNASEVATFGDDLLSVHCFSVFVSKPQHHS